MGCGRVGAQLATELDREGHEVTVLDLNAGQFQRFLPPDFRGRKVVGDGRDQDALRRAGVEGTIAQGVRSARLRRTPYFGHAKTHLAHLMTAAAMNLVRLLRWLADEPTARTRNLSFAQLHSLAA